LLALPSASMLFRRVMSLRCLKMSVSRSLTSFCTACRLYRTDHHNLNAATKLLLARACWISRFVYCALGTAASAAPPARSILTRVIALPGVLSLNVHAFLLGCPYPAAVSSTREQGSPFPSHAWCHYDHTGIILQRAPLMTLEICRHAVQTCNVIALPFHVSLKFLDFL